MGILSEVLMAAAPPKREEKSDRVPGISISQLFPCPYRLYKIHLGEVWKEKITAQQYYNMADGWDQEEQSVRRLAAVGVKIEERQRRVTIGKSRVPGSIDGTFTLDGKKRLWEHKAYDGYSNAVQVLTAWGIDRLPNQKAQTNGYMLGLGLDEASFFVKVKNNNDYKDPLVKLDRDFIEEIVEWCDKIRLEQWQPEPKECKWCPMCGLDCFGTILDFSWITSATDKEMEEEWIKGDQLEKVGSMMKGKARFYFVGDPKENIKGVIGDKEVLVLERLEIKRIIQHRFDIKKEKVLEEFGPEGLLKVGEESEIVQYRFNPKGVY